MAPARERRQVRIVAEETTPADDDGHEYIEARVLIADWQLERFLDFCEKELKQLPELSRIPGEKLNGYRELFALLAAHKDRRLNAKTPPERQN
jgi:hypothetical protein